MCQDHSQTCYDLPFEITTRNSINETLAVDEPQISFSPPAPTSTAPSVVIPALAVTTTPNATIR